jgi:SAM-dependent methyltransferase
MQFLTDVPSFESMEGKYEDIYVEPDLNKLSKKLVSKPLRNGKRILDIGCNHGTQLIPAYNAGWEVFGIDLNVHAIKDCRKYLTAGNFEVSTIEDVKFPDKHFEKIQTFHVLEHIYDPMAFLKKIHSLLEKGGELEIRIPNGGSLEMKVWGKYSSQSWVPFHINMFDNSTIKLILEKAGFKDIRICTNPIPWWWILSYRQYRGTINIKKGVTNFHQNIFHKGLQVVMYPILYIVALFNFGEELHVRAYK